MAAPAAMDINRIESMIEDYLVGPEAGGNRKLPDIDGIGELNQYIEEYISNGIDKNVYDRIAKVLILYGLFYKNIMEPTAAPAEGGAAAPAADRKYLKEMVAICKKISSKTVAINLTLEEAVGIEATLGGKRSSKRRRVTFKKRKH
jgi:hypothetical protein